MFPRRPLALLAASFLALGAGAASAQSNDPSFRVNNRSGATINEIYVSSARDQNWGRDLLGQNTLPSGESFLVRLPAGQCLNDIRIVFDGGRAQERRAVNTCEITDFNVTP